ncbi:MAG TPA: hypothetical protein PLQ89_21765 [Phycisphaerae bacterium]|nr:hypothetical protein [Phycisphaerae bacterium]
MAAKSSYLAKAFLRKVFKNQDFSVSTVYVGATIAGSEVSGGGYARVATAVTNWTEPVADGAGGEQTTYTQDVLFPKATAAWGTVNGFILADAPSGGNILYGPCALSTPVPINKNDQLRFDANQLVIHEA